MIQKMRLCATNKDKSRPCTLHSTTSLYKEVQEQQSLIERSVAAIEKHSTDKCAQRKALKSIFTTIKHNPVAPQKLNNNTYKSISQKDVKSIAIAKKDLPKNAMFQRKEESKTSYIKNHYNRSDKTFSCSDIMDINREIFLKSSTKVFIDV